MTDHLKTEPVLHDSPAGEDEFEGYSSEEIEIPVFADARPEASSGGFAVGVSTDKNSTYRRTMEDAHQYKLDFCGDARQMYVGVFDGHAGPHAAEWCGRHFHTRLEEALRANGHGGTEDRGGARDGGKSVPVLLNEVYLAADAAIDAAKPTNMSGCTAATAVVLHDDAAGCSTLYCANVGDARIVLSRGGDAIRLTYDHKGSDRAESLRVQEAGGFVINNRVNGVLAVTRSLGDVQMKDYVLGRPYTTETRLGPDDQFFIVACDGLWDVCSDQDAVNLVRSQPNAQAGAQALLTYALGKYSTDNLSVIVVSLN